MKNRISENPGRVLITPENGSAPFYATMTRADNPTQEGDPLDKNTLLKDATAALYGLDNTAVPDDVLSLLKTITENNSKAIASGVKIAAGSYIGTGTYGSSNKNSLTFPFSPKIVFVVYSFAPSSGKYIPAILIRDCTWSCWYVGSTGSANMSVSWAENIVEWFGNDAEYQLNNSGNDYHYVAIG